MTTEIRLETVRVGNKTAIVQVESWGGGYMATGDMINVMAGDDAGKLMVHAVQVTKERLDRNQP